MAYPNYMMEVRMEQITVSTAAVAVPTDAATGGSAMPLFGSILLNGAFSTPTSFGSGVFAPLCIPHKVHRIGVRMSANLANPIDLIFWKRIEGGATTWATDIGNPTGEFFRMMLPTVAASGKAVYKNVTGNYIVRPGEALCAGPSTAEVMRAVVKLLVSPVWEEGANVTSMVQTTAP